MEPYDRDTERHMREAMALGNSHDYQVPAFLLGPPGTPQVRTDHPHVAVASARALQAQEEVETMICTVVECTIVRVSRKGHSVNGNPTKVLYTNQGAFTTAVDAGIVFAISDLWENKRVRLGLNGRGRVIDLEVLE